LGHLGFCLVDLVFQILLAKLRKDRSAGNIVAGIYIPAASVSAQNLSNFGYVAGRLE